MWFPVGSSPSMHWLAAPLWTAKSVQRPSWRSYFLPLVSLSEESYGPFLSLGLAQGNPSPPWLVLLSEAECRGLDPFPPSSPSNVLGSKCKFWLLPPSNLQAPIVSVSLTQILNSMSTIHLIRDKFKSSPHFILLFSLFYFIFFHYELLQSGLS